LPSAPHSVAQTQRRTPAPQPSKRKAALLRQINKKTRKGRPGHSAAR